MNDTELTNLVLQELRVGGPQALSDDERLEIAQTTLLKLYKHYPNADSSEKRALCRRIARRTAIDHLRRKLARERAHEDFRVRGVTHPQADTVTILAKSEIQALVMQALVDRLAPDERRIIHDRFFRDRTLAEIAADLQVPISTIHARLMRALAKLSSALGRYKDLRG